MINRFVCNDKVNYLRAEIVHLSYGRLALCWSCPLQSRHHINHTTQSSVLSAKSSLNHTHTQWWSSTVTQRKRVAERERERKEIKKSLSVYLLKLRMKGNCGRITATNTRVICFAEFVSPLRILLHGHTIWWVNNFHIKVHTFLLWALFHANTFTRTVDYFFCPSHSISQLLLLHVRMKAR